MIFRRISWGVILTLAVPSAKAAEFTITDLGTLGGPSAIPYGINSSGQVAGDVIFPGGTYHAFLYGAGVLQDLGTLGRVSSSASSINSSGQVVGDLKLTAPASSAYHAFLFSNGIMQDLGTLGGKSSSAYSINDSGVVVGLSDMPGNGVQHGFVFANGTMHDLGIFSARAINNAGVIAGELNGRAYLYNNGALQDLGTIGGNSGHPNAINDAGQVVGLDHTVDELQHAVLYNGATMLDLGTLAGPISLANSINNLGQVVGFSWHSDIIDWHGYVYAHGVMRDLNNLIDPAGGWTIQQATGINDAGQIIAIGTNSNFPNGRGLLLTPTLPAAAVWTGQTDGTTWNSSSANWTDGIHPAIPFTNPTPVVLDDSAPAAHLTLNLPSDVAPDSITINCSTNNFTFTGPGSISTHSIIKVGGSTFSIGVPVTGSPSVDIRAGTMIFSSPGNDLAAITGAGEIVVAPAGSLTSDAIRVHSLTINGQLVIRPNGTPAQGSKIATLALAGTPDTWTGKLDLANNFLIVGSDANLPNQLKQAANLGAWNGTGGITSSSAQSAALFPTATALAYATGAQFTAATGQTLFAGQSFNPTDTLILYTLAGDANMDGAVTFADFLALQNHFNQAGDWQSGDLNYDGTVTFADFLMLQNCYNKSLSPATSQLSSSTPVPEPGTLLVLALSLSLPQARRWRTTAAPQPR